MTEQTANLCTTDAAESLRAVVAERDLEIERLKAGQESLILARDEQKRLANEYRDMWSRAAVKAQPSGVVLPEPKKEIVAWGHDMGGNYDEGHADGWNDALDEVARLNSSPVSDGDERAGWTEKKPTGEGAYWIRGNGLEADALVQVKQKEGELWCNLHMRNSEPDFEYGYTIEQLSSEFEWLGPLQARATLSAPSHSEQVREGWQLVPVEPNEAIRDAINLLCDDHSAFEDSDAFWSYLLAATPSAGSQEQGE